MFITHKFRVFSPPPYTFIVVPKCPSPTLWMLATPLSSSPIASSSSSSSFYKTHQAQTSSYGWVVVQSPLLPLMLRAVLIVSRRVCLPNGQHPQPVNWWILCHTDCSFAAHLFSSVRVSTQIYRSITSATHAQQGRCNGASDPCWLNKCTDCCRETARRSGICQKLLTHQTDPPNVDRNQADCIHCLFTLLFVFSLDLESPWTDIQGHKY